MDDLSERLAVQMKRAFFDVLSEKLAAEDVKDKLEAVEWLVKLHDELGKRFAAVLPSQRADITDRMDNVLFAQQLRAGTYGSEQLGPLIEYTWALLRMACAPDMDAEIQSAYNAVADSLQPGAAFSTVVPLYLKHAHGQLDEIIRRIEELRPVAQNEGTTD